MNEHLCEIEIKYQNNSLLIPASQKQSIKALLFYLMALFNIQTHCSLHYKGQPLQHQATFESYQLCTGCSLELVVDIDRSQQADSLNQALQFIQIQFEKHTSFNINSQQEYYRFQNYIQQLIGQTQENRQIENLFKYVNTYLVKLVNLFKEEQKHEEIISHPLQGYDSIMQSKSQQIIILNQVSESLQYLKDKITKIQIILKNQKFAQSHISLLPKLPQVRFKTETDEETGQIKSLGNIFKSLLKDIQILKCKMAIQKRFIENLQKSKYQYFNVINQLIQMSKTQNDELLTRDKQIAELKYTYLESSKSQHESYQSKVYSNLFKFNFKQLIHNESPIWKIAHNERLMQLLVGQRDNQISIWNLKTQSLQQVLKGHEKDIQGITISPDGKLIATCGQDKQIRIWVQQANQWIIYQVLQDHTNDVWDIQFQNSSKTLISASSDKTIRIWSLNNGQWQVNQIIYCDSRFQCLAFGEDYEQLACGTTKGFIIIYQQNIEWVVRYKLFGHQSCVKAIDYNYNNTLMASCSEDKTIRIWNVQKQHQCIQLLSSHTNKINSLKFHPKINLFVSGGFDSVVKIWKSTDNLWSVCQEIAEEEPIFSIVLSEDILFVSFHKDIKQYRLN